MTVYQNRCNFVAQPSFEPCCFNNQELSLMTASRQRSNNFDKLICSILNSCQFIAVNNEDGILGILRYFCSSQFCFISKCFSCKFSLTSYSWVSRGTRACMDMHTLHSPDKIKAVEIYTYIK